MRWCSYFQRNTYFCCVTDLDSACHSGRVENAFHELKASGEALLARRWLAASPDLNEINYSWTCGMSDAGQFLFCPPACSRRVEETVGSKIQGFSHHLSVIQHNKTLALSAFSLRKIGARKPWIDGVPDRRGGACYTGDFRFQCGSSGLPLPLYEFPLRWW